MNKPSLSPEFVRSVSLAVYRARFGDWYGTDKRGVAEKAADLAKQQKAEQQYRAGMYDGITRAILETVGVRDGCRAVSPDLVAGLKRILTKELVDLLERQHGAEFTRALCGEIATL